MIGLVIVSHSHRLAEGVKELAQQMGRDVPIAAAGGLDDETIGTNAERIQAAIEAVYQPDGVLILMDLGSAVQSAEAVLDYMLPEDWRPHIRLSNAPLVEGAIAAAVQASLGEPLDKVEAAACAALSTPKASASLTLSPPLPPEGEGEAGPPSPGEREGQEVREVEVTLTIRNRVGLHARPAAQFVQTVGRFQAAVQVRKPGGSAVDAHSIFGILGLNARQGDQIIVSASGVEADAALQALTGLVEAGFGEDIGPGLIPQPPSLAGKGEQAGVTSGSPPFVGEGLLQGIPASPGIAIGSAWLYQAPTFTVTRRTVENAADEWHRLVGALTRVRVDLEQVALQTARRVGAQEARIFEAHQQFLDDPSLINFARARIEGDRVNAEAAMADATEAIAQTLAAIDDDVIRQRAADVRDVGARVLQALGAGASASPLDDLAEPVILLAHDLTPSETAQLDPAKILGIATAVGGATSHTAILARSLGVPAVVGLGETLLAVPATTTLIVDGAAGQVWVAPAAATEAAYRARQAREQAVRAVRLAAAAQPAVTQDGHRVHVWANVGDVATARRACDQGAEGVGLLRTEFLFLDRTTPPSEEEQVAAYRAIAEALDGRPVTVRTLDIGGDKPAPYLNLPPEANPFLGQRAIRLCLARPELFMPQLRAILRVAADHPLKIMFPMVAVVEELQAAKALVRQAQADLAREGIPHAAAIEVGIMVEVPSAALIADYLAAEADFLSLGTNDLTQYTFAADRGNPAVAALGAALHPAILRQIDMVVRAARERGRAVSVCGEMASDPAAVPLLVGFGVDTLSVNPGAVPDVKAQVRGLRLTDTQQMVLERV